MQNTSSTTRRRVLMIIGDYSEDYEVMCPYQMMIMCGHEIDVCCPKRTSGDRVIMAVHDSEPSETTYTERRGHYFTLNKTFDSVKPEDYDGLILPGGRAPEVLRLNKKVLEITKHFMDKTKPVAVICHGIQLLTPTGTLKGKTVTCHPTMSTEVTMTGGTIKEMDNDKCLVDGNLCSAPSWPAVGEWMRNFCSMLGTKITTSN